MVKVDICSSLKPCALRISTTEDASISSTRGHLQSILARLVPENPRDLNNSMLGFRVFSKSAKSNGGRLLITLLMWVWVKPWALNRSTTELGFFMFSTLSFLEAEMADSKDNPQEFWRKERLRDCGSLELWSSAMPFTEEADSNWTRVREGALCFHSCSSFKQIERSICTVEGKESRTVTWVEIRRWYIVCPFLSTFHPNQVESRSIRFAYSIAESRLRRPRSTRRENLAEERKAQCSYICKGFRQSKRTCYRSCTRHGTTLAGIRHYVADAHFS